MCNNIKDIGLYCAGTQFSIPYEAVLNCCNKIVKEVEVHVALPPGVIFSGTPNIPKGTFSDTTGVWTIGSVLPGQCLAAEFMFEVVDDCLEIFDFEFIIKSIGSCDEDDCFSHPKYCAAARGTSCCKISECLSSGELQCQNLTF